MPNLKKLEQLEKQRVKIKGERANLEKAWEKTAPKKAVEHTGRHERIKQNIFWWSY